MLRKLLLALVTYEASYSVRRLLLSLRFYIRLFDGCNSCVRIYLLHKLFYATNYYHEAFTTCYFIMQVVSHVAFHVTSCAC